MFNKQLVRDLYGQYYKIHTSREQLAPDALEPKQFHSTSQAYRFISDLVATTNYWKTLYHSESLMPEQICCEITLKNKIAELLCKGCIKAYKVEVPSYSDNPPEKRTLQSGNKDKFIFTPASSLLFSTPQNVMNISSKQEADKLLSELSPDSASLKNIIEGLDIPVSANNANSAELMNILSNSLASGEIVIIVDKYSAPPSSDSIGEAEIHTDKDAGSGTSTGAEATAAAGNSKGLFSDDNKKEDIPPCTLEWVSVECSHGRNTGITKERETIPTLAVVATETVKKDFDTIKATIHAGDLCDKHSMDRYMVTPEHIIKQKSPTNVEFTVSCEPWDKSNFFDRVWLPSVSPKSYNISIKDFCNVQELKVFEVNVDVYPEMKWHWKTQINLGKLEFEPGKAKVKYSDLAIDGNVVLTYDQQDYDAKEKYKKYVTEPLETFQNVCDGISAVLEVINDPTALMRIGTETENPAPPEGEDNRDGNGSNLTIQWPKLDLGYDSSIKEGKSPDIIDHDYTITIKAKPLLEIDIEVDVLDVITSFAPRAARAILKLAKKKIQKRIENNKDTDFEGELDIRFKVSTTIDITEGELSGVHNIYEHDLSGKPVQADIDIPVELIGVAKAKGRWLIISFDIDYKIRGEAGWKGQMEFGKDETGIYMTQLMEFTGVVVTLTKYAEAKAEYEVENQSDPDEGDAFSDFGFEAEVSDDTNSLKIDHDADSTKIEAKTVEETEQRWEWLTDIQKPNETPQKTYLFNY